MNIKANSYVYLIESTSGHFKIGKSNNPEKRLSQLKTTQGPYEYRLLWKIPFESEAEATQYEWLCHEDHSDTRVRGEWFALTPKDLVEFGYIASLTTLNYLQRNSVEV